MRISEISAGVPIKLPTAPAAIPIPAFIAKFGGLPSLQQQEQYQTNVGICVIKQLIRKTWSK